MVVSLSQEFKFRWLGVVLFATFASQIGLADEFRHLNWFQIHFCEKVNHLGFDAPQTASALPGYGFSGDQFNNSGLLHFYRWDLLTGAELLHVTMPPSEGINRVDLERVAVRGNKALIASGNHDVILFDLPTARIERRLSGHRFETESAAFGAVTNRVAAVDVRNRIWVWGETDDRPETAVVVPASVMDFRFAENDTQLDVWSTDRRATYSIETGALLSHTDVTPSLSREHFAISADGERLAATGAEKVTYVYNRTSGALLWQHEFPRDPNVPDPFPDYVWGHAFSPNGRCLIVSLASKLIALDAATGEELTSQPLAAGHFYMSFTPDSRYLVSGGGCDINVYETPAVCR
jgi:WD40 repeat protein